MCASEEKDRNIRAGDEQQNADCNKEELDVLLQCCALALAQHDRHQAHIRRKLDPFRCEDKTADEREHLRGQRIGVRAFANAQV